MIAITINNSINVKFHAIPRAALGVAFCFISGNFCFPFFLIQKNMLLYPPCNLLMGSCFFIFYYI